MNVQSHRRLALVLACVTLAACGPSPSDQPGVSTTSAPCPAFGSTREAAGRATVVRTPAVALLRNVQVQASACEDDVGFLFWGGVPGWSVGYRAGTPTQDPSGLPAPVPGHAYLVVRLSPASGVDLASNPPDLVYDGPTVMNPPLPSSIAQVRRLGDFEAVTTWVIGLPAAQPFEVVTRSDQVVIRLAAPVPRATRCALPGTSATVGYPPDWYAELSDRWRCRYFDSKPFVIHPATDDISWSVTVQEADTSADQVIASMTAGRGATIVSHTERVAGLAAAVLDATSTGAGLHPAGYRYRMYVIGTTPNALLISGSPAPDGPAADGNRAAVDRMAALLEFG